MSQQKLDVGYEGDLVIELFPDAGTEVVSRINGITINEKTITVPWATATTGLGGIQCYYNGKPFAWSYDYVKKVLNKAGEVLWKNRDLKE